MAAPKYYSDGWSYPVAFVECGGNVYLDFDTGQANLVDYYREYRNNNLPLYIILLSLMAAFTAAGATLLLVNNKKSSKKRENNI